MSDLLQHVTVGELLDLLEKSGLTAFFNADNKPLNVAVTQFGVLAYDLVHQKYKYQNITVPSGYALVKTQLNADEKLALIGEYKESVSITCHHCGGDGCEECDHQGQFQQDVQVSWTTTKQIYKDAIQAQLKAKQQEG